MKREGEGALAKMCGRTRPGRTIFAWVPLLMVELTLLPQAICAHSRSPVSSLGSRLAEPRGRAHQPQIADYLGTAPLRSEGLGPCL